MSETLIEETRRLLVDAAVKLGDAPESAELRARIDRLDQPLRVALAGRVKAGKSTLINALIGDDVAATDAGECTRVVAWYEAGPTYRVEAVPHRGSRYALGFRRVEGRLEVDLADGGLDEISHLVVEVPASPLNSMTLIDTPGVSSLAAAAGLRTERFLLGGGATESTADAIVYLMRHLHPADSSFLEAFRDRDSRTRSPVNSITVLARADEIGNGRADSLELASRVARELSVDQRVRILTQAVLPVSGLLARTAETLREEEFIALATVSRDPHTWERLRSVDSFRAPAHDDAISPAVREQLLDRLGLFGVRLAITLMVGGLASNSADLRRELLERSGLQQLRHLLATQFAERAEILKAAAALETLRRIANNHPDAIGRPTLAAVERLEANAHALTELRIISEIRSGSVLLETSELAAMERLVGGDGVQPHRRLGLPATATTDEMLDASRAQLERWQRIRESRGQSLSARRSAEVVVRSVEELRSRLRSTAP